MHMFTVNSKNIKLKKEQECFFVFYKMYAYKIKLNSSLILFPKVREKYCAREINNKDLQISIFWIIKFAVDQ